VHVLHPPQKFERPPFWYGCSYGIKKIWRRGHHQWHDFPTEFHKILPSASKVDSGDRQTDGDLISLHFSFRKEIMIIKLKRNVEL
jgi:hypothetical protein